VNKYNATSDDGNKKTDCAKSERKFGTVCREKDAIFEKCGDDNYGYQQGKPCVFLKLNKIYDWIPEVYTDAKNLPEKMPEYLKKKIEDIDRKDPKALEQDPTVWVSCEGEYPGDIENLGKTDMEIYSNSDDNKPGFSARFFPYTNQPEYVQPIVAVQFKDIKRKILNFLKSKI
jgi:sodium/potassium-transporting ATPase subunit beta